MNSNNLIAISIAFFGAIVPMTSLAATSQERIKLGTEKVKALSKEIDELKKKNAELPAKIEKLRQDNECEKRYLLLAKPMADVIEKTLANSSSETSVARQMNAYSQSQSAYFAALESAVQRVKILPVDSSSLGSSVQEVSRLFSVESDYERTLMSREQALLETLSRNVSFMRSVQSHVTSLGLKSCSNLGNKPAVLEEKANAWRERLQKHYTKVGDMTAKRMRLREALSMGLSGWLVRQGAIATATSIDSMLSTIDEALKADRFLAKVQGWWHEAHGGRGPARGLMITYQQYQSALLTLKTDIDRADQFAEEAKVFKLPPDALTTVSNFVSGYKKTLQDQIVILEKDGWQKKLTNQRAFLDHYERTLAKDNPLCLQLIKSHRAVLLGIATMEEFSLRESGFIAVVDACRKQ